MGHGLRLGPVAGTQVVADWSLLIIFVLIAASLAGGVFPRWHPNWRVQLTWLTALAAALLFFASLLAHELSHALVGRANGVVVRRITLFMFGGMAHMEGEPPSWRTELLIAIVGPVTSLVLGYLFMNLAGFAAGPIEFDRKNPSAALAALNPVATLLIWLGPVNIMLGLFNLVPGFPLDGGRVLRAALWGLSGSLRRATRWASLGGQMFAWLLMSLGIVMVLGLRVPILGTGFLSGLWIALVGWFLNNAALMSYRQLVVRAVLEDVRASRIMQTRVTSVDPGMRLENLSQIHLKHEIHRLQS